MSRASFLAYGKVVLAGLGMANVAVLAILSYALFRGLDVTDEGMYLLLTDTSRFINYALVNYNLLFHHWHDLTGHTFDLIELRVLRILLVIFGSILLFYSVWPYMKREHEDPVLRYGSFMLILLTGWLSYTQYMRILTPGYNVFALFLSQAYLASFLCWQRRSHMLFLLLQGVLIYLLWLTKFTIAILLPIACFAAWYLASYQEKGATKRIVVAAGIVALVPIAIISLYVINSYPIGLRDHLTYLELNPDRSHSPWGVILNSMEFVALLTLTCVSGILSMVILRRIKPMTRPLVRAIVLGAIALFTYMVLRRLTPLFAIDVLVVFGLAYIFGIAIGGRRAFDRTMIFPLLVFMLPILISFGTNNSLPRFCFALVQFFMIAIYWIAPRSFVPLALLSIVLVPLRVHGNIVLEPYRQRPLTEQDVPLKIPVSGRTILVSPITAEYITSFNEVMQDAESDVAIGTSRIMAEFYFADVNYPQRILWFEENVTPDYFAHFTSDTPSFTLVMATSEHYELFATYLAAYEMELFGKLPRRGFLEETRGSFLSQMKEVGGPAHDTLYFYHCRKPGIDRIKDRSPE